METVYVRIKRVICQYQAITRFTRACAAHTIYSDTD